MYILDGTSYTKRHYNELFVRLKKINVKEDIEKNERDFKTRQKIAEMSIIEEQKHYEFFCKVRFFLDLFFV